MNFCSATISITVGLFVTTFVVASEVTNTTATSKSVCANISDCSTCNESQCVFAVLSCNNETKNEPSCVNKELADNCTIVQEIKNCSIIAENATIDASTNVTNGSTPAESTTLTVPTSTDKVPPTTAPTTVSSTVASTSKPTTEPTTKPTTEPAVVTTSKPTSTPTSTPPAISSTVSSPPTETSPNSIQPSAEPKKSSGFDTGSFIGGIVLTLGLMAIAFVGYKFYRARTEHNYHTLLLMDSRPSYSSSPHLVV